MSVILKVGGCFLLMILIFLSCDSQTPFSKNSPTDQLPLEQWDWEVLNIIDEKTGEQLSFGTTDIWFDDTNNIYVTTSEGHIWEYRDKHWNKIYLAPEYDFYLNHYGSISSIWSLDGQKFYIGGYDMSSIIYDGVYIEKIEIPDSLHPTPVHYVGNIEGNREDNLYAPTSQGILRYNGSWEYVFYDSINYRGYISTWVANNDKLFAVSGKGYITTIYNNRIQDTLLDSTYSLAQVMGNSANDVYVVGGEGRYPNHKGLILHYNGFKWSKVELPEIKTYFRDIYCVSPRNVFVVSDTNTVLHYNGFNWKSINQLNTSIRSIHANEDKVLIGTYSGVWSHEL